VGRQKSPQLSAALTAPRLRTLHRAEDIASVLKGDVKVCQRRLVTEPQIALVMRAHPTCNLDNLTELSFEFDHAGRIIDCTGTIKDGGNIDHNYAGSGLMRLYERARRQWAARQTSATILQFPNGDRLANA